MGNLSGKDINIINKAANYTVLNEIRCQQMMEKKLSGEFLSHFHVESIFIFAAPESGNVTEKCCCLVFPHYTSHHYNCTDS